MFSHARAARTVVGFLVTRRVSTKISQSSAEARSKVYDPSELRSDVNGKVVRYLHDEGAEVAKGESYIELEAMKMIMSLKAGPRT